MTRLKMTIVDPPKFCANSVNYIIIKNSKVDIHFLLGILNSRLTNWYFKTMSTNSNVNGYEVDNLPILNVAKDERDKVTNIVIRIMNLPPSSKTDKYEEEINQLIYTLYGLTGCHPECCVKGRW